MNFTLRIVHFQKTITEFQPGTSFQIHLRYLIVKTLSPFLLSQSCRHNVANVLKKNEITIPFMKSQSHKPITRDGSIKAVKWSRHVRFHTQYNIHIKDFNLSTTLPCRAIKFNISPISDLKYFPKRHMSSNILLKSLKPLVCKLTLNLFVSLIRF